jgi:hypothetical protein
MEASIFTNDEDKVELIKSTIFGELLQNPERYSFGGVSPVQYVFELHSG